MAIISLVAFYAVFLMLGLVISVCWKKNDICASTSDLCMALFPDENTKFTVHMFFLWTDFLIMALFLVEIFLKTFGYGLTYIGDVWNMFDALIVITSFVCWVIFYGSDVGTTGLGLLRLLRLVRVMVMISDSRKRLKKVTQSLATADGGSGGDASKVAKSHVERVLDLLERLQGLQPCQPLLPDLEWITSQIIENKLYQVSVGDDRNLDEDLFFSQRGAGEEKKDAAVSAWISQINEVRLTVPPFGVLPLLWRPAPICRWPDFVSYGVDFLPNMSLSFTHTGREHIEHG